jgi:hypothetical protein
LAKVVKCVTSFPPRVAPPASFRTTVHCINAPIFTSVIVGFYFYFCSCREFAACDAAESTGTVLPQQPRDVDSEAGGQQAALQPAPPAGPLQAAALSDR